MVAHSVPENGNQQFTKKSEFFVSNLPTVMRKVWDAANSLPGE
jgi:hypothetical protein